jgi:hypothetical protein
MTIRKYSQFLAESKNASLNVSYSNEMSILENEYLKLKSEGLNEEEINENIFASLLGSLGGGFTDTFKDYVIDWATEKLGIEAFDETGQPTFFYQVIRNIIEQVHFTDLGSYFGKGSCKFWSKAVVEGLSETLQERGIEYLLPRLGLKMDMQSGMGATIAAGLREALTNAANNTAFMNNIETMIGDKICGFNLGDVIGGKNVTDVDKQKIASEIQGAENKDPNIFTKAAKSGLTSILNFTN